MDYENAHRDMWRWLADTGSTFKGDWPNMANYMQIYADCFACESIVTILKNGELEVDCDECPIEWGAKSCLSGNSVFTAWRTADNINDRKRYAKQIAEMPWRDKT